MASGMPSKRSAIFRGMTRVMARLMDRKNTIEEWRALSSYGSRRPFALPGVKRRTVQAEGVPCEWLCPASAQPDRTILFLHGGGFVLGWYNSHRILGSQVAAACKACVLAADYRLAPEYPYPAALEDCVAVYRGLLKTGTDPKTIIVAGDSAGGTLTLTLLLALKASGDPLPSGGICLSPATDLASRGPTYETNAEKEALLTMKFVDAVGPAYVAGADPTQPLISPLYGDLRGLPPLLIQAGGDELLLSDAVRFAQKAQQSGVDVTLHVYPGMWHVWQGFTPYLPEARQAMDEMAAFADRVWRQ